MNKCVVCGAELDDIIIHCLECPAKFCPQCYIKCPQVSKIRNNIFHIEFTKKVPGHLPSHKYKITRANFLRRGMKEAFKFLISIFKN